MFRIFKQHSSAVTFLKIRRIVVKKIHGILSPKDSPRNPLNKFFPFSYPSVVVFNSQRVPSALEVGGNRGLLAEEKKLWPEDVSSVQTGAVAGNHLSCVFHVPKTLFPKFRAKLALPQGLLCMGGRGG